MTRTLPTEASLGLTPTDDELASVTAPSNDDDDIPLESDTPEPEPVAAKPDEQQAEKPADPEPGKPDDPKTVDLRALQEARAAERELKQRNTLLESRLNDVLAVINRQQPAPQQEQVRPANEIPPEDDVVGRINWLVAQTQQQGTQQAEAARQREADGQREQFRQALGQVESQFREAKPDYDQAVNFAAQSRDNELALLYPLSTAEQRQQAILGEWDNIVNAAINAGINPAEQVYRFAQARGFQAQAQAPQPAAKPGVDVAALASAQQRHQSLSDAPGGETVAPLDAKALARMSDKDFKAWMSKKGNEAKFDEIMGR